MKEQTAPEPPRPNDTDLSARVRATERGYVGDPNCPTCGTGIESNQPTWWGPSANIGFGSNPTLHHLDCAVEEGLVQKPAAEWVSTMPRENAGITYDSGRTGQMDYWNRAYMVIIGGLLLLTLGVNFIAKYQPKPKFPTNAPPAIQRGIATEKENLEKLLDRCDVAIRGGRLDEANMTYARTIQLEADLRGVIETDTYRPTLKRLSNAVASASYIKNKIDGFEREVTTLQCEDLCRVIEAEWPTYRLSDSATYDPPFFCRPASLEAYNALWVRFIDQYDAVLVRAQGKIADGTSHWLKEDTLRLIEKSRKGLAEFRESLEKPRQYAE